MKFLAEPTTRLCWWSITKFVDTYLLKKKICSAGNQCTYKCFQNTRLITKILAGSKLRGRKKKSWSFSPTSSLIQVVKRCRIHNKFLDGKLKVGAEWSIKIEKKSHFKCKTNRGYFVCNYMDSQPTFFLHCGGAEHSICCNRFLQNFPLREGAYDCFGVTAACSTG